MIKIMDNIRDLFPLIALAGVLTGCGSDPVSSGQVTVKTFSLSGGAKLDMVWIEPGKFTMGSPLSEPGRSLNEGPLHELTISRGFYLGRYEVTQGQWGKLLWRLLRRGPDGACVRRGASDARGILAR